MNELILLMRERERDLFRAQALHQHKKANKIIKELGYIYNKLMDNLHLIDQPPQYIEGKLIEW